jgi:predicted MPP superfamily phosphohydrolase
VLHVSDLHLTPTQRAKQAWVNSLAELAPDLLVNTGDTLSHPEAIPDVMKAFGDLRDIPGVYVFGSNDYWAPVFKNPLRYFLPSGGKKKFHGPPLPWRDLKQAFDDVGWVDLDNQRAALTVHGVQVAFAGVDDPHLGYDRIEEVAGPADLSADLRIGVTHAPYLRVLDAFAGDGYDVPACLGHLRGPAGADCLASGCRARRACPIGGEHAYAPAQMRFHMTAFGRANRVLS